MILEPGALLNNRYRIIEVLGQGGMGSIYRARDENLDIDVAVKDNLFTSIEYARQFRREATILATLRHSGLPRVTDHFLIDGQGQYLVMDFIEGEDLRQRMERIGTLPEEEVIVIGAAICDALMYLCSRDPAVVHRDIKPGNVKITPDGEIYLVDFGLAKTIQGSQATTTGARAMTPGYSPPEQYGTARTDLRTDIFSLGATLYAALTGLTPEDSLARAMNQIELTPIRSINPRVSKKVASVIEKALELMPEDRYQTPEHFKQALLNTGTISHRRDREYYVPPPPGSYIKKGENRDHIQDIVISANSKSSAVVVNGSVENGYLLSLSEPPKPRSKKIRKTGCMLISILIIVIAGLGTVVYNNDPVLTSRVPPQSLPIKTNTDLPTGLNDQVSLISTQTPTTFPQNVGPLLTMDPQISPTTGIPTPTIATQTIIPLLPSLTPTILPTSIGGGKGQIAYASKLVGEPQIFIVNSDGTNRKQITNIPEGACQPDFSPDGQQIVFISPCDSNTDYYPGSSMYIINLDGTGLLPLPTMVGGDYDPDWSPDGKKIAFTSLRNNNRSQVYVIDLADNEVKVLSEKYNFDSQPAWSPDGKWILFVTQRNNRQDIWVMHSDGSNQRQFSRNPSMIDLLPSWSPDGENVLITQYLSLSGVPRVVIAPFDLENYVEYQIGKERRPMREAMISPDGYWIAFEGWEIGGKHNIFLITTTGISVEQVTHDLILAFDLVWRPSPKP